MEAKYFNKWEAKNAISLIDINPEEAKKKYEEYIEKYPSDYSIYPYYASTLITLGMFDEAAKVIDYVESTYKNNLRFIKDLNKVEFLEKNIVRSKLRLLTYQGKYKEAYNFYLEHSIYTEDIDAYNLILYWKSKIGKWDVPERKTATYLYRQMIEYHENDFLSHIKWHMADYNIELEEPNPNIFMPDFPIEKVLAELKKYLSSDKRIYPGFFEDVYIFKYNGCGRDNNRIANFFKIVCFHNTEQLITMVPISKGEGMPYIDLNYLIEEKEDDVVKIKRLSQIDKFNLKYRKK